MLIIILTENGPGSRIALLRSGLKIMGTSGIDTELSEEDLCRTADGKPFFINHRDIHFSLSHSGDYIACSFSDRETGLDLQENKEPHTSALRIAKRFFAPLEYENLLSVQDPAEQLSLFYRLWTIKESYLKFIGCGLRGRLDSFLPEPLPLKETIPDLEALSLPPEKPLPGMDPPSLPSGEPLRGMKTLSGGFSETADLFRGGTCFRGRIRPLAEVGLLFPADYALLPAISGYTMSVCSDTLNEKIKIFFRLPE